MSWNPGIEGKQGQGQAVELRILEWAGERVTWVRVRLSYFVPWNPGIEGKKGSGVRLLSFISWNHGKEETKVRVKQKNFMFWNHGKEETKVRIRLSNFVSWNPGKEDIRSGSGGQASKFKLESLETEKKGQNQAVKVLSNFGYIPKT